jgi:predicted nucleic acid-binding Zn ribbon protein
MEKLADLFSDLLSEASKDESVSLILLQSLWAQVVGKQVARCSQPKELYNQSLKVVVNDPSWENELKAMTGIIKAAVNRFWGQDLVSDVTIQLD